MSIPSFVKTQLSDIERNFATIERQAPRKVILPAMRKAVVPIKNQAKINASKWKSISKLIRSRAFIAKSGSVIGKIFVGPSKDRTINIDGRSVGFEVAANIIEFGRAAPGNKGGTKTVQPEAFLRNAPNQKGTEAMNVLEKEINKNMKKFK